MPEQAWIRQPGVPSQVVCGFFHVRGVPVLVGNAAEFDPLMHHVDTVHMARNAELDVAIVFSQNQDCKPASKSDPRSASNFDPP